VIAHLQDVDLAWFRNPLEHITMAADITTSSSATSPTRASSSSRPRPGTRAPWPTGTRRATGSRREPRPVRVQRDQARARVEPRRADQVHRHRIRASSACRDLNRIATVHMTCCKGLENKLFDLKRVILDWKRYTARPRWEQQGRVDLRRGTLHTLIDEKYIKNLLDFALTFSFKTTQYAFRNALYTTR
jgi:hypothetical protein